MASPPQAAPKRIGTAFACLLPAAALDKRHEGIDGGRLIGAVGCNLDLATAGHSQAHDHQDRLGVLSVSAHLTNGDRALVLARLLYEQRAWMPLGFLTTVVLETISTPYSTTMLSLAVSAPLLAMSFL